MASILTAKRRSYRFKILRLLLLAVFLLPLVFVASAGHTQTVDPTPIVIGTAEQPQSLVYDSGTNQIFAADYAGDGSPGVPAVSVISDSSNTVVDTITSSAFS